MGGFGYVVISTIPDKLLLTNRRVMNLAFFVPPRFFMRHTLLAAALAATGLFASSAYASGLSGLDVG